MKVSTKDKIINAAVLLFNQKGFSGTSVREIAKSADVNVAHISYYFKGKGGLMEHLVSEFYEGYSKTLEKAADSMIGENTQERILRVIFDILSYQHDNRQLTRFVYREVTIDSTLIREIMSTYLMKEKYILQLMIEDGQKRHERLTLPVPHFILQLKSLLMMPYLQPQYITEVLYMQPHEPYFYKRYFEEVTIWIKSVFHQNDAALMN
ncbi:forespore capture DNA-binding protein RefZ [Bacillus sp. ISL-51]|uniref:forespore capture DNA-binding protein RefZ n=1 Tax=unclassified Bacillus (in: firmicutes) TaxID=185979 RepID=UPI001BE60EFB|nr:MULTISPECIES: forespore capture DNA-binding protein RefZ [unclassified Bacillus (in: firmicutes)]MBT2574087.1 forespore capture DNA-binding protein RefZ [Bacillus sp. ISL-51]MBT2636038.1 forespore capture DNA-binding protein RefZ [Bacillus sp. ISL-26]